MPSQCMKLYRTACMTGMTTMTAYSSSPGTRKGSAARIPPNPPSRPTRRQANLAAGSVAGPGREEPPGMWLLGLVGGDIRLDRRDGVLGVRLPQEHLLEVTLEAGDDVRRERLVRRHEGLRMAEDRVDPLLAQRVEARVDGHAVGRRDQGPELVEVLLLDVLG